MKIIHERKTNYSTKKVMHKLTVTDGKRKEIIYKGENASEAKLLKENMQILINGNHLFFDEKRLKTKTNNL